MPSIEPPVDLTCITCPWLVQTGRSKKTETGCGRSQDIVRRRAQRARSRQSGEPTLLSFSPRARRSPANDPHWSAGPVILSKVTWNLSAERSNQDSEPRPPDGSSESSVGAGRREKSGRYASHFLWGMAGWPG